MAPKSKKANGFLMFMLDYKRNKANSGNEIDMNTAQLEAGELWMKMSAAEREKFSNKPSSGDSNYKEPTKYTSFGVTFDEIDRQKEDEKKKVQRMNLTIEEMLLTAEDRGGFRTQKFYFFSTIEFVQTLHNDIFPAEIAMSEFSLRDGVTKTLHILVNPGRLPLGMAAEAGIRAKLIHKRDLPPHCDGETDYSVILSKMFDFMEIHKPSDMRSKFPPLFVEPGRKGEEFKSARMTLDKITSEAGEQNLEFRLFQTENLLLKLHKKCNERFLVPPMTLFMAQELMQRDSYMYDSIGCDFHDQIDSSQFCCLSKVQRWAFEISKICSECDETLEMIPGKHFPEGAGSVIDVNDVVSSESRETSWGSISGLSNSMKHLTVDSSIDLDETASSMPKVVKPKAAISYAAVTAQESAESKTSEGSETLHLAPSFSHLIRLGRGGKNNRGGKRSDSGQSN